MNLIDISDDRRFVEAWHNGMKAYWASVQIYGLHGAYGECLNYLRQWTGQEPAVSKTLQSVLDVSDNLMIRLAAYGK